MHIRQATIYLAAFFVINGATAQIFPGQDGQQLLQSLRTAYKPVHVQDYDDARDIMYSEIYNVGDSVSCVYSGHTLYVPPGQDPSTSIFMNGSSNGINCEHTYPQSKGAESGNAKSDMHHLFPARAAVNEARGNDPFGEVPDTETLKWYYLDQVSTSIPTDHIEAYSERKSGLFEPREDHKGNVARAMFYFYTMYQQEADEADPAFFALQKETLCQWHYLDPADSLENLRTQLIADYQDGIPNPYILDCTVAARTYCGDTPGECPLPPPTIVQERPSAYPLALSPNPASTFFSMELPIETGNPSRLQLIALTGRPLLERTWMPGEAIQIDMLPAGIYFVTVQNETGNYVGRLVKY